jgi:hypothetical protein
LHFLKKFLYRGLFLGPLQRIFLFSHLFYSMLQY